MSKLKELVEWLTGLPSADEPGTRNITAKARALLAEEQNQCVDFAAKYYNEVAKNSVLYDLGAALIEKLQQHDPNDPILEKAEEQLNGNGYSLGRPVAEEVEPLVELACRKRYTDVHIDGYHDFSIDEVKIKITGYPPAQIFKAQTYPAAEKAARAYLNSLPDKGEGK